MVELDYDQVLEELTNLTKKSENDAAPSYPDILDRYLETVAKNGDIVFPWSKVKPLVRCKLELVMDSFHRDNPLTETQIRVPNCKPFEYGELKGEIMKSFDWFYAAPFTIQRLCELLINPGKHYRRTDKFMRGIEKNVLVVSTVQPRPNKYATPETMEKQANFKEMYPLFSSPSHNNHSSSTSSASGSSSPSVLNGSIESTGHGPNNSFEGHPPQANSSPYHSMVNSFYDQAPPQPSLNNSHHPHLLDTMNDGSSGTHPLHPHAPHAHHGSPHGGHASPHHNPHSSPLAPLQQLDSFTNVFATTTTTHHHHLTHLTSSSYGPLDSTHLTNGSGAGAWSQESPLKHHSPYESLLNASGPHLHHPNDHLNDDNENIIVDDDEEEEGVTTKDKTGDPFFYTTDSSNSTNTSDSSSYNSDNSNGDKDEVVVITTASELVDAPLQQSQPAEPISCTEAVGAPTPERCLPQELTPKKRPSPTPPVESPEKQCIEALDQDGGISKDEIEAPLTPKKLRVQQDDEEQEPTQQPQLLPQLTPEPVNHELGATSSQATSEVEVAIEAKEQQEQVIVLASEQASAISIAPSSSIEEVVVTEQVQLSAIVNVQDEQQPQVDDSTPMDMNMAEEATNGVAANAIVLDQQQSQQPMSQNGGLSKGDDIAMQTGPALEDDSIPDDQVMDEPMDQE